MDIIFDLDGTLADIQHRIHFIQRKPKNYDAFHYACVNDRPILAIIEICRDLWVKGNRIIICSGRSDMVEAQTRSWLDHHEVMFDKLLMRKDKDYRQDCIIKKEMLDKLREEGYNPVVAFDDRQQVVDMWRENGLICCQVAPGNF